MSLNTKVVGDANSDWSKSEITRLSATVEVAGALNESNLVPFDQLSKPALLATCK